MICIDSKEGRRKETNRCVFYDNEIHRILKTCLLLNCCRDGMRVGSIRCKCYSRKTLGFDSQIRKQTRFLLKLIIFLNLHLFVVVVL